MLYDLFALHVCSVVSDSLQPHGLLPPRLLCPQDSPGKNTGVVALSSPGDLPNPGIYQQLLDLLHCQADSLPMSHLGLWEAPRIPLDTYLLENAIGDVATYEQGYMKDVSP